MTQARWVASLPSREWEKLCEWWLVWIMTLLVACFCNPYQLQWMTQGVSARLSLSIAHKEKVHWLPPKPGLPKRLIISSRLLRTPQFAAARHALLSKLVLIFCGGPASFLMLLIYPLRQPSLGNESIADASAKDEVHPSTRPLRQWALLRRQPARDNPLLFQNANSG